MPLCKVCGNFVRSFREVDWALAPARRLFSHGFTGKSYRYEEKKSPVGLSLLLRALYAANIAQGRCGEYRQSCLRRSGVGCGWKIS